MAPEVASNNGELAAEQAYVTALYERLDALRDSTKGRLAEVYTRPTAENDQAYSEREQRSQEYRDRAAELDAAERNLCFGRLDFDDEDDTLYIGRIGLRSEDHETILADSARPALLPRHRQGPDGRDPSAAPAPGRPPGRRRGRRRPRLGRR